MPGLLGNPNIAAQYAAGIQSGIEQQMTPYNQGLLGSQAAYYGQEAQAKGLENQRTMMMMPMFQKAIQEGGTHPTFNTSDGQTPTADLQVGDATNQATRDQDPALATGNSNTRSPKDLTAAMESYARTHANKYAPVSMAMDPQNARQYSNLVMMGKADPHFQGMADGYRAEFEAHQGMINQMNQIQAEKAYMNAMGVYRSDDSHIRESLEQADPAARNNPQLAKLSPAQLREYAGVVAGSYFPYTGRPMGLDPDGYHIDSKSGWKVPGARSVGLKPEDYQKAVDYWSETAPYTINGETRQVERWIGTNESRKGLGMAPAYLSAQDAASKNIISTDTLREGAGKGVDQQGNPIGRVNRMAPPADRQPATANLYKGFEPDSTKTSVDLSKFSPNPQHIGQYGDPTDPRAIEENKNQADMEKQTKLDRQQGIFNANTGIADSRRLLKLIADPNTAIGPGTQTAADIQSFLLSFMNKAPQVAEFARDPANAKLGNKLLNDFGVMDNMAHLAQSGTTQRFSNALIQTEMSQMAANMNLNRGAVQAMLKWSLGNYLYEAQKWGGDYVAAQKSKTVDMGQYSGDYENAKKRSDFIPAAVKNMDNYGNIKTNPMTQRLHPGTPETETPKITANVAGGTVVMKDPTGKTYNIPIGQKDYALSKGLTL